MIRALILAVLLVPQLAAAQQTLNTLLVGILKLIGEFLLPFAVSIAVLAFIINVFRYFIVGSGESDKRAIARQYMLYSLLAFMIIVSFWSIISFIADGVGLKRDCRVVDQYVQSNSSCPP